jgi:hypothetical protein
VKITRSTDEDARWFVYNQRERFPTFALVRIVPATTTKKLSQYGIQSSKLFAILKNTFRLRVMKTIMNNDHLCCFRLARLLKTKSERAIADGI